MNKVIEARQEAWSRGVDDGPPPPKEKRRPGKDGASELVVRPASNTATADTRQQQQHLEAVTAAFAAIDNAECNLVEAYIIAGESLVRAKAAGSHGSWLVWLSENFQRSDDSAERAMRFWHHRNDLRKESARVRNFSVRKALEFISQQKKLEAATPAAPKPRPATKQELKERVEKLEVQLKAKSDALDDALAKPKHEPAVNMPIETTIEQPVEAPTANNPSRSPSKATLRKWRTGLDNYIRGTLGSIPICADRAKIPPLSKQEAAELINDLGTAVEGIQRLIDRIRAQAEGSAA